MSTCICRISASSSVDLSLVCFSYRHDRSFCRSNLLKCSTQWGISLRSGHSERSQWVPTQRPDLPEGGSHYPIVVSFKAGGEGDITDDRTAESRGKVIVAALLTVVLGVGNRVLYKLALVPLKQYPFFLAQFATFGYVAIYFSILYLRYHAGIVTDEMLSFPKSVFLLIGLLEALAATFGMAAGAVLSGASIPILSQTFLVWQLVLSAILLGRTYRVHEILGCVFVVIGVATTVASGSVPDLQLEGAETLWGLVMITSFFFQAADTVLKEIVFSEAAKNLKGGSVDLFVVNSYGSAFQAIFICLLLPVLLKLRGVTFGQLATYLKDGAACFLNLGTISSGISAAW